MKQQIKKTVLILLAFVVFLTGMGTTIVNFCCDSCVDDFFSNINVETQIGMHDMTQPESCCAHKKETATPKGCAHHENEKECCKIERQSTVLDSYHSKPIVFAPVTWVSTDFGVLANNLQLATLADVLQKRIELPPKIKAPRSYLSLIRILII